MSCIVYLDFNAFFKVKLHDQLIKILIFHFVRDIYVKFEEVESATNAMYILWKSRYQPQIVMGKELMIKRSRSFGERHYVLGYSRKKHGSWRKAFILTHNLISICGSLML